MGDTNFKYDIAKPFQRTGAFPLDRTSVFTSLSAATAYAAGDGSLGKSSYLGQVLAVVEGNSVDIYKIGFDSVQNKKVLMPIGGGITGTTIIEHSIVIGDTVIPVGSNMTEAFEIAAGVINDMGSTDGTITDDIIVDGETYAEAGTPITTVLGDVYYKIIHNSGIVTKDIVDGEGNKIIESGDTNTEAFEKLVDYMGNLSPNLEFVGDEDIEITVSGNVVTIGVKGISNSDEPIVLDEKKTITLSFNVNGGTGTFNQETELTWGDYVEFELPADVPTKGTSAFIGWKVDTDASGEEDFVIYQPGDIVRIVNITELEATAFTATALALWDDTPLPTEKYVLDLINEGYARVITGSGGNYIEILETNPYTSEQILDLWEVAFNEKQLTAGTNNVIVWTQPESAIDPADIRDAYDGAELTFTPRAGLFWQDMGDSDSDDVFEVSFNGGEWIAADYPWGSYSSQGIFAPRYSSDPATEAEYNALGFRNTPKKVKVNLNNFSSIGQVMFTQMRTTEELTLNIIEGQYFGCHDVVGMFESDESLVTLNIVGDFRWDTIRTCLYMFDACHNLTAIPYNTRFARSHPYNELFPRYDGTRGTANVSRIFNACTALTSIGPIINMSAISRSGCTWDGNQQDATNTPIFYCPNLTDVLIKGLGHNSWNFTDDSTGTYLPLISADSIDYLLQNVQNVVDCTLTLPSLNQAQVTSGFIELARGKGWNVVFA